MSEEPQVFGRQPEPLLIVISGPSGVGKDTVLQRLKNCDMPFHFVVTVNTRPPRPGEVEGVDYIFISHEQYFEMKEKGELLEHAKVYNDFKGVPKAQVQQALESGKDVLMRLDVQGAARVRELVPEAVLIFLTTTDEDELVRRLEQRKTEKPEDLKVRIATAREEFKRVGEFDYVVVNPDDRIDEALEAILSIIRAEHHRVHPRKVNL